MENMRKEIRNRRILTIIAVLVIGLAYYVTGQVTKEIRYEIIADNVLSFDAREIRVDDITRVYASNIDSLGNEISFELEILNIDDKNNIVSVSFFELAFFPANASGTNPDYINFIHGDNSTDVFLTDGKKLVDIWLQKE